MGGGEAQHLPVSKTIYYLFFFESTKVFLVTGGNIKMGSLSASNPPFSLRTLQGILSLQICLKRIIGPFVAIITASTGSLLVY